MSRRAPLFPDRLRPSRLRAILPGSSLMLSADGTQLIESREVIHWLGSESQFLELKRRSRGETRQMLDQLVLVYAEDTRHVYRGRDT